VTASAPKGARPESRNTMKTTVHPYDDETKVFFESENAEETVKLMLMVKRSKKPITAYGHIQDNGLAWAWVFLPARKNITHYAALEFNND